MKRFGIFAVEDYTQGNLHLPRVHTGYVHQLLIVLIGSGNAFARANSG